MNIYQIDAEIEKALEAFENGIDETVDMETGEVIRLEDYISELKMTKEAKIVNLALYVKNRNAFIDALKDEKKNLDEKIRRETKHMESAMDYLREVTDGQKVEDSRFTISYRKTEAVKIADGAVIPEEFLVYKEPTPSKTELKKAIKAGREIDGVSLVQGLSMSVK